MGRQPHQNPEKPSPDSTALSAGNSAKTFRDLSIDQALESARAEKVQTLDCVSTARSTSVPLCCGPLQKLANIDNKIHRLTATEEPLAARPSHTSAVEQCTQATANRCADSQDKKSEEWESDSMNPRKADCDQLYVHSSRGSKVFQNRNADTLEASKI